MKKIFSLLLSFMLCCTFAISAAAATEPEDNLDELKSEIVTMANNLYGVDLCRAVIEADIDFDLAQKIYTDTNIFELETTSYIEISEALNNGTYIYELPVYIGDDTIIVNIQKGLPLNPNADLTNDEREEVLNNVGKWIVSAMFYYEDTTIDYGTQIAAAIDESVTDVLLVGSLPYFRTAVAITANEQGEITTLIPLASPYGTNINTFSANNSNVYDYSEIRAYVNNLPEEDENLTGSAWDYDNNFDLTVIGVAGIIFSVVGLISIVYFVNRRKEKVK